MLLELYRRCQDIFYLIIEQLPFDDYYSTSQTCQLFSRLLILSPHRDCLFAPMIRRVSESKHVPLVRNSILEATRYGTPYEVLHSMAYRDEHTDYADAFYLAVQQRDQVKIAILLQNANIYYWQKQIWKVALIPFGVPAASIDTSFFRFLLVAFAFFYAREKAYSRLPLYEPVEFGYYYPYEEDDPEQCLVEPREFDLSEQLSDAFEYALEKGYLNIIEILISIEMKFESQSLALKLLPYPPLVQRMLKQYQNCLDDWHITITSYLLRASIKYPESCRIFLADPRIQRYIRQGDTSYFQQTLIDEGSPDLIDDFEPFFDRNSWNQIDLSLCLVFANIQMMECAYVRGARFITTHQNMTMCSIDKLNYYFERGGRLPEDAWGIITSAIKYGRVDVAKMLLDRGVEPKRNSKLEYLEVLRILIERYERAESSIGAIMPSDPRLT